MATCEQGWGVSPHHSNSGKRPTTPCQSLHRPLNLPGEKSITITWDRGEKLLTPYVGLSAWRDNTQCEASSLDKKFVRKVAAVDRRARPRPLCNSAPLETETYAKPLFLPQMMQPWTHCLNQKENERPSSLSFLACFRPHYVLQ